nr:HNH endonuclease family protein [Prauserella muralis]
MRTTFARTGSVLVLAAAAAAGCLMHGGPEAGLSSRSAIDTAPSAAARPAAQLAELRIAPRGSLAGYSDEAFPHWREQGDSCDTREVVLRRDGQGVITDAGCSPISGRWYSPYDGATWTDASDVDVDHVVPRANAWVSGAAGWDRARRTAFANDLTRPELIAVTDNVNQSKGDRAPEEWKPPQTSAWCRYASAWIAVKHHYRLTVTHAERDALAAMLGTCGRPVR